MSATIQYKIGDTDTRPWGRWEVLSIGDGFIIKKIDVNPGAKLSLQSHDHRSEHWTILSGQADITLDDEVLSLTKNGTVFIPVKSKHRIENTGDDMMSFIEIQTGATLDENDIVRYQDDYGRS